MISAAVVGLGRIGFGFDDDPLRVGVATHAAAFARHPMVQLAAGIDPDEEKRRSFESRYGVRTYATLQDALGDGIPDVASVCTPPATHADLVTACVAAGITRVICEKPCTPAHAEVLSLERALGDKESVVGVNFTRRYDPLARSLTSSLAREGVIGGAGFYTAGLLNTATHWIDLLLASGAVVEAVTALGGLQGADPTPNVVLHLSTGDIWLQGLDVDDYMIFEADLFTRRGRVRYVRSGAGAETFVAEDSPMYSGYNELVPSDAPLPLGLSNPMLCVIDDAVASIEEDRPMLCTLAEAREVHAVVDAIRTSLATGSRTSVMR